MFKFSLVEFSIRRPKLVVWVTVALTLLFLTQFPNIKTDTNPKHMLPENSDVRVWNNEVDKTFALYEDTIVVGVQNDSGVPNRDTLVRIARVTDAIIKLEGVASRDVNSFTTITNVTAEAGTLKVGPLMPGAPQTDAEVEALHTALFGNPLLVDRVISKDGKTTAIYVPLEKGANGAVIAANIREIVSGENGPERYYVAGDPVARDTFGAEMFKLMAIFAPIAGMIMFAAIQIMFRNLALSIAMMGVSMAAIIWSMGALIGAGYPEFASFELVVAPGFRESRIPDANRFRLYDPMPTVTNRETVKPRQGDVGLRAYRDIAGYDAALYLYRGFQRTPSMRSDNMAAPAKITYFYPKLSIYGASLSGRAGEGVLSLEAAYYDSHDDRAGSDFAVPNSQTRLLVGYQIQPAEDVSLGFQYYAEHMHDYGTYLAALPAGFPVDKRWSHTVTARLTQLFLHQTLRFSVYVSYNDSNGDHFVNPELHYSFTDKVWGAVGTNLFGGKPWGQFGQLARDDNLYLQARYEF